MTTINPIHKTERTILEQLLTCLSHPTRRRILMSLAAENSLDKEEFESPEFKPEDEELGVFRIQLYQKHLPCLVEGGYITWGRDTDTITRGPDFEEMRTLIELITNHQNELSENWP